MIIKLNSFSYKNRNIIKTKIMNYQYNSNRFKPFVNDALAKLEITDINDLQIGEPYLIDFLWGRSDEPTIKMKGTFIKLFNASTMTHMICRNHSGRIISAPLEHSRVYKSPKFVYGNTFREKAVVHVINAIFYQTNIDNDNDYKIENTIGHHLGRGWVLPE
jgi:hypothetical protein